MNAPNTHTRPMTLREFRATGEDVADLAQDPRTAQQFFGAQASPGRIYAGDTYIERSGRHWSCTVANDSRCGTLPEMEAFVFEEWALSECDLRVPCPALPTAPALAREFCRVVRQQLDRHMPEILRRNRMYGPQVCATHDFCDANMLMAAAFSTVWGQDEDAIDAGSEDHAALWSAAWDLAKEAEFNADRVLGV